MVYTIHITMDGLHANGEARSELFGMACMSAHKIFMSYHLTLFVYHTFYIKGEKKTLEG